jgi:hypothetical protein
MLCTVNGCTNRATYKCVYGCLDYHIQNRDLCYLCINSVMRKTLDKRALCITCTGLIEDLLWSNHSDSDTIYVLTEPATPLAKQFPLLGQIPLLGQKIIS